MGDASSGLVQVQRDRLTNSQKKALKKKISKLDREIQSINADRDRCSCNLQMFVPGSPFTANWRDHLKKLDERHKKLDAKRKEARAKLKGYA